MEEIYISMKDASKLEEAVYKTFLKQVSQRVKKEGLVIRTEKSVLRMFYTLLLPI